MRLPPTPLPARSASTPWTSPTSRMWPTIPFAHCGACQGWSRADCRPPAICAEEKPMRCWFCSMAFRCASHFTFPATRARSVCSKRISSTASMSLPADSRPDTAIAWREYSTSNQRKPRKRRKPPSESVSSTHTRAAPAKRTMARAAGVPPRAREPLRPVLQYLSVDAGRPSYSDLSLTGTHRPRADLQLSGNVLWATDEYALNDDDERAEISSRTRYSWLSAEYTPSETLSGNLWLGHSRIEIDRVGDVDKPEFAVGNVSDHRDANLWDARASLNWHWSDRSRLNMGFEWTAGSADYSYDSAVTFPDALAELFDREPGFRALVACRTDPASIRRVCLAALETRRTLDAGDRPAYAGHPCRRDAGTNLGSAHRHSVGSAPAHRTACPLGAFPPGR